MAIQNARLFREIAEKGKQLEVASQHKSDFLASMSHELRTPLNAILGFNEMILGQVYGEVPADMQEPLEDIQTSGKHLLRLINNVLDLAKIEAGRMELALRTTRCRTRWRACARRCGRSRRRRGWSSSPRVPSDMPLAYGDARPHHAVPDEPRRQFAQVHQGGQGRDLGRRRRASCSSTASPTPASASRRTRSAACSPSSSRPTPPSPASTAARAWACPSARNSSRCTAGASGWRASWARARRSSLKFHCG